MLSLHPPPSPQEPRTTGRIWISAVQWAVFVLAAVVVLATVRLWLDGQRHFSHAVQLQEADADWVTVVGAFENAARAWMPGSPWPERALWHLSVMGRSASMRGDVAQAIFVWEVVRRSILSTRYWQQPNVSYLAMAEAQLVRLHEQAAAREAMGKTNTVVLQRPADPSPLFSLLIFVGLGTWILASLLLCVSSVQSAGKRRAVLWVLSVSGFALWAGMSYVA
ncbi:MAG: hypothetical protein GX146_09890 [Myxococcales bacterium]|nr:hypothetical protein [Myxococcales bacterium]